MTDDIHLSRAHVPATTFRCPIYPCPHVSRYSTAQGYVAGMSRHLQMSHRVRVFLDAGAKDKTKLTEVREATRRAARRGEDR